MRKNVLKFLCIFSAGLSLGSQAATFDISGNARIGSNMFSNLDLASGNSPGSGSTTSYLEHRLLLRPDVVVDDRFTIKSELLLLNNGPADRNQFPRAGGTALGSDRSQYNDTQMLFVRRAWLDWSSDWGIFRFGRQPKSWGLGLLHNAGNDVFDDYGTTVDRVGFEALVGSLNLNFGYEKAAEFNVNTDGDDAETYEVSVQYSNPEDLLNVGLLYARNIRSGDAKLGRSSHDLSLFAQKKWGNIQVGGEYVFIDENETDSRMGALVQVDYTPGNFAMGLDGAYASSTDNANFNFHANYRPFLILFNQSLTAARAAGDVRGGAEGAGFGSNLGTGSTGGGAILGKAHFSYGFSDHAYVLGTEIGYATFTRQGNAAGKKLGVEWDLHFTQKWYENFKTVYAFGVLFPGKGLGPDADVAWGAQIRGALEF